MSATAPEVQADLTDDQQKVLSEVFQFEEGGDLSESDIEMLAAMFDTPAKFVLLRRALQVLTPAERGLTFKDSKAFIETPAHDVQQYAFDMAVDLRSDEKVRTSLVSLWRRIGKFYVEKKRAEFEAQNKAEFEEKQRTEEYDEKQEEDRREIGDRI